MWTPRRSPVNGNGTYTTPTGYTLPTTGTVTGTYQWDASYSGDGNNKPVSSDTADEQVTVSAGKPDDRHSRKPHRGARGGHEAPGQRDALGRLPTGRRDHLHPVRLGPHYGSLLRAGRCQWQYNRRHHERLGADRGGTYYWTASYSGDANNIGGTSGASDEPVTVSNGTSSITTVIVDTSGVPVTSAHALGASRSTALSQDKRDRAVINKNAGATVLDTATVGTLSGITPTGTVTYSFTGTNGTSLAGLTAPAGWTVSADKLTWTETVTMSGGKVPDSAPTTALPPGSYVFVGQYSGDANFPGATSAAGAALGQGPHGARSSSRRRPPARRSRPTSLTDSRANRMSRSAPTCQTEDRTAGHATLLHLLRTSLRAELELPDRRQPGPRPILCSHSPRCPATSPCTTPIPADRASTRQRDDYSDGRENQRQQVDPGRGLLYRNPVQHRQLGGRALAVRHERHGRRHIQDDDLGRGGWCRNRP